MTTDGNTAWKRLEAAIGALEAEQAKLRHSIGAFQGTLGELNSSVGTLGHTLSRYGEALAIVRSKTDTLAVKSRKLAATMDGYLTAHAGPAGLRPPPPPTLAAVRARAA